MERTMLHAKLHRVLCTHSEPDYEGSCAIDNDLLNAGDILPYQQIDVYNITNGHRFTTYAIGAVAGSGIVSVNGAAAHRAKPGDLLIIAAYARYSDLELDSHIPRLIYVDASNRIRREPEAIPPPKANEVHWA